MTVSGKPTFAAICSAGVKYGKAVTSEMLARIRSAPVRETRSSTSR
jgi:hypothetical protein